MKSIEEIIESNMNLKMPKRKSMAESNSTDKEIAEKLGVGYSTFKRHKSQNRALKELMAQCKDKKNEEVERSLFKCCNGYKYKEEVAVKVKEEVLAEDGTTILVKEHVEVREIEKYKGPDLAAQKYWLNNMKKTKWADDPNKVANDKKLTKLKEKEINSKALDL